MASMSAGDCPPPPNFEFDATIICSLFFLLGKSSQITQPFQFVKKLDKQVYGLLLN
jgi:hypothetical protein